MESKKVKLKVHHRNFSGEEMIVNCEVLAKEKITVRDGDLLEIFQLEDQSTSWRSHLILKVKTLPADIQSKGGPFSLLQDVAVAFSLSGLREVRLRKVDQRDVALDLVELTFKDQHITRSDMWRITCSLFGRCVYGGQHLEHSTMRLQTNLLWYQGDTVSSGAISHSTRVVFRSLSAQVFLFIQISSEMWDFDPNGEFFFDKAVNGFLRELFERWREAGCNHDVTIIFFWRLHYPSSLAESLANVPSVQEDKKRDLLYEDFFRVIVESTSNSDWSSELINIKKSFLKLNPLIRDNTNAGLCKSEDGNILEAINLALNIMERQNLDTNLQLSGQQIVVLTAGTGYFEIERRLMQLTNKRLVYGGVTTDLVSMRDQPLHAMPMFKFHSKEEEFFSIPHWINYSFYSSSKGCGQHGFQPRIYLSDHLVNTYLKKDETKTENGTTTKLYRPASATVTTMADHQLRTWVDTERYDALIFDRPNSRNRAKIHSVGRMTDGGRGGGRGGGGGGEEERDGSPSGGDGVHSIVTFNMGDPDPFEGQNDSISPSPEYYHYQYVQPSPSPREAHLTRSLAPPRQRYKSETYGDGVSGERLGSSIGTRRERSNFTSVGSAERLHLSPAPWDHDYSAAGRCSDAQQPKKILSFSNPFDPSKIHSEAPAFQRRWVHIFPTNKRGVAFQTHHEAENESLASSEDDTTSSRKFTSASSTPQVLIRRKGILKNSLSSSISPGGFSPAMSDKVESGSLKMTTDVSNLQVNSLPKNMRRGEKGLSSTNGTPGNKWDNSWTSPGNGSSSRTTTPNSSRQQSTTNTPESLRQQRLSDQPLLQTENFASVRRTGVDWTSLVKPGHLPITTDFYPAKELLDRDYVQYNTSLVVFRDDQESTAMTSSLLSVEGGSSSSSNERKAPLWHSDHSTMTTIQAFQEMISQRLTQGFQLTCPPASERSLQSGHHQSVLGRDYNTVFTLQEALEVLRKPRLPPGSKGASHHHHHHHHRRNDSVTVHMGLSHVFQKLVLAFQDISVFIYRQKTPLQNHPLLYSYQLSTTPEGGASQTVSAQFSATSDDYNWNYLDNHICGYSDFEELGESLKYWELRYLLLPKTPPTLPPLPVDPDRKRQEHEMLISNFVCFLEFLNHLKKTGPAAGSRKTSSASSSQSLQRFSRRISRSSLTSVLDPPPLSLATSAATSASHSLSPSPTPTPSHHISTPGRSRQLAEIEEEEEKKLQQTVASSYSSSSVILEGLRNEDKRRSEDGILDGDKRDRDGKGGGGGGRKGAKRVQGRRQASMEVDTSTIKKARSRESLLQVDHQPGSRSRHDSPSHRDSSHSPSSLTPLYGDTKKDSPRTERKKIIKKLRKIALEDGSATSSDGEDREKTQESAVNQERVAELESSLDFQAPLAVGKGGEEKEEEEDEIAVSINSPLKTILTAMENETDGIDFLGSQAGLSKRSFIAMDAVKWIVENVKGVGSRRQASKLLQSMIKDQMVVHASQDPTVPFLDGYFFYSIPQSEEPSKDTLNSSYYIVNSDMDSFSRRWFEAEIMFPSSSLLYDRDDSPSPPSLSSSLRTGGSSSKPYYMEYDHSEETYIPPSIVNRRVELNPDPHLHSSRPEWCYVHYDRVYDPCQAFQLRFQWTVTTTNLLSTLIQSWVRNASMCDFNLVAVPVHRNLQRDGGRSATHPFRRPSFIPLLSLPSRLSDNTENEDGSVCSTERTRTLLMAIASRNGFLPDCPPPAPDTSILSPHYTDSSDLNSPSLLVHHTGCALIQLVLPGESFGGDCRLLLTDNSPSSFTSSTTARGGGGAGGGGAGGGEGGSHLLHQFSLPGQTSTPRSRSPVIVTQNTTTIMPGGEGGGGGGLREDGGTAGVGGGGGGERGGAAGEEVGLGGGEGERGGPTRVGTVTKTAASDTGPAEAANKVGFLWYRNPLLPKQKNAPPGLVTRYREIFDNLTDDCHNQNGMLDILCQELFR